MDTFCAIQFLQYVDGQFGFISGESYEHEEDPDYESNAQEKEYECYHEREEEKEESLCRTVV